MTHHLTHKQCETAQRRVANGYGDKWPYKGYNYPKDHDYDLPDGWVYVYIPTWGIHIRRVGDEDYKNDL